MRNVFKPEIKALIVLHTAFLVGQVLFLAIICFMSQKPVITQTDSSYKTLQLAVALLTIACIAASFFLFRQRVNSIQSTGGSVAEKIERYRAATIIKFSLLEAPYMLGMIAYFLTGNMACLILAILIMVVFAAQRPTVPLLMYHLQVSRDDLFEEVKL